MILSGFKEKDSGKWLIEDDKIFEKPVGLDDTKGMK